MSKILKITQAIIKCVLIGCCIVSLRISAGKTDGDSLAIDYVSIQHFLMRILVFRIKKRWIETARCAEKKKKAH